MTTKAYLPDLSTMTPETAFGWRVFEARYSDKQDLGRSLYAVEFIGDTIEVYTDWKGQVVGVIITDGEWGIANAEKYVAWDLL